MKTNKKYEQNSITIIGAGTYTAVNVVVYLQISYDSSHFIGRHLPIGWIYNRPLRVCKWFRKTWQRARNVRPFVYLYIVFAVLFLSVAVPAFCRTCVPKSSHHKWTGDLFWDRGNHKNNNNYKTTIFLSRRAVQDALCNNIIILNILMRLAPDGIVLYYESSSLQSVTLSVSLSLSHYQSFASTQCHLSPAYGFFSLAQTSGRWNLTRS